ncbi:hypothetical protein HPP92_020731 [Vanilla planifolia]|uniref:Uncharacterized protein n=1 Tax=Vanilla planifolia TaxID=51239 RepID=A0A835PW08_VANPL|nr:hypothetical protein HPP92_021101 [Vanilla planifolia]KAG0462255.1 hypothetical protein HPP92_020731 [Vanilla planifolia]
MFESSRNLGCHRCWPEVAGCCGFWVASSATVTAGGFCQDQWNVYEQGGRLRLGWRTCWSGQRSDKVGDIMRQRLCVDQQDDCVVQMVMDGPVECGDGGYSLGSFGQGCN